VERPTFPASSGEAIAEAERAVAWLRLPAIGLIAMGASLDHPDPDRLGFLVTLALFSAWSVGVLAYVHLREAGERFALVAPASAIALATIASISAADIFAGM